jgi:hypothetical protein
MINRVYTCNTEYAEGYGLATYVVTTFGNSIAYMLLCDLGDEILWNFDKQRLVSVQTHYTNSYTYVTLAFSTTGDNETCELAFEEEDMAELFVHYCEGLIERNTRQ